MSQAPPPVFHDANLHLAVLQAACKEGRLPWFDKARYFAETRPRPYDDAAEYNYRSDAEIEAALLALDIEPHLGDIRAIDWDASAEVIASIWTYWDGRDTRFDIRSPAGIERLERFRCAFCAMGDLSPLRELDQLREVVLVGARITSLLDFARMPALERLDLRGCTLLDHKQIALERSTLSGLGVQVTFDGRQAPPTPRLSRRLGRARQRSVLPPEEHRSTRPPKIVDRAIPIPAVPAMALMESVDPRIPAVARALSVDFTGEPQIHSRREDTNLGYRPSGSPASTRARCTSGRSSCASTTSCASSRG